MKLYQANLSPFAARVRVQIYAKGLDVQFEAPPGGLGSPEFLKINPTGKVPCLVDGAFALPESEVICEYLEDKFPAHSLRPADPHMRAKQRLLNRLADLYIYPPASKLFQQMNPKTRDQAVVDAALTELDKGLKNIEMFVQGPRYALEGRLTLADCALATILFFPGKLLPALGRADAFADVPKLGTYMKEIAADPVVKKVWDEMNAALTERMKQAA
jgi:glutathione S-transferase